jgi:hypothetical protein
MFRGYKLVFLLSELAGFGLLAGYILQARS